MTLRKTAAFAVRVEVPGRDEASQYKLQTVVISVAMYFTVHIVLPKFLKGLLLNCS
jgi:hypothetical protein